MHVGKKIDYIMPPNITIAGSCALFALDGHPVADPVVSSNYNFSVPKDHTGYKDIMVLLHAAQMTGRAVTLSTSGTVACGAASLDWIVIYQQ